MTSGLMHFAFVQMVLGALVAGIDAGAAFPTWPLMNGSFFPADAFYVPGRPAWRRVLREPRTGAIRPSDRRATCWCCSGWWSGCGAQIGLSCHARAYDAVGLMLVAQVGLGIAAVLTAAPLHAAVSIRWVPCCFGC